MPKKIIVPLLILCATLFIAGGANASWLDKLKDTATELTDKAAEALKEAEPESPTTSDGEGQAKKPATTTAPAAPKAPAQSTVTAPTAPKTTDPAPAAPSGNNDKALVMATQEELKRLGYKIGVDGAYGPNTKKQIMAFEQSQSLEPTGDASVELLAKLKETPTPAAEPATTTATTAAPAPKAEEPKAAEAKAEPASAPMATTVAAPAPEPAKVAVTPDILEATVYKNNPDDGNQQILITYPLNADGQINHTVIYFRASNNKKKYSEFRPSRDSLQGDFKAYVKTEKGSYEYEGRCYGPCRSRLPKEQHAASYDDFTALSKSGGILEFSIESPNAKINTYGDKTYKVRVPSLDEQMVAQAEADKIAAAKQAEADKAAAEQAKIAAAQKAEEEKKAAHTATLSPEAKMTYENCENGYSNKLYYSCTCIAEKTDAFVDEEVAKRIKSAAEGESMWLNFIQKAKSNPKYTDKQKEQSVKHGNNKLEQAKQSSTTLKNQSSWDKSLRQQITQSAELKLYNTNLCKRPDGVRENEYDACRRSSSTKSQIKGEQAQHDYCTCVGNKAAELWTASDKSAGSSTNTNFAVQARLQCKN